MAIKDGKDYLYLIWKCSSNRRQYIVAQLTKNGQYEFKYCEDIEKAIKSGFELLVSFEKLDTVYKSEKLFPVFASMLPDRKRKDIGRILEKYGLDEYDAYQLLKKSGAKLPIDNLQFIDPILDYNCSLKKSFSQLESDTIQGVVGIYAKMPFTLQEEMKYFYEFIDMR